MWGNTWRLLVKGCHVRLFGVLTCRVIRFILARLIIDSNRWLLISYKQWLSSSAVFASNINETKDETWLWKNDTIDDDDDQVIDDTSSNVASDNDIPTC